MFSYWPKETAHMPHTNGDHPSVVRLRLRLLEPTYETLAAVAKRYGASKEFLKARDSSGATINLEPLLDLIAEHLEKFVELVPEHQRKFFARRGEKRPKLTDDQIRQIRASTDKVICIAHEFGVSISTVSQIRTGKRYRFVN